MSAFPECLGVDRQLVGVLWVRLHCTFTLEASERAVVHRLDVRENEAAIVARDYAVGVRCDCSACYFETQTHSFAGAVEHVALDVQAVIA